MIISLYQIDSKLLEAGIAKLDIGRKTPLKKVIIEHENINKKGQGMQVNLQGGGNPDTARESVRSRQSGPGIARY